MSASLPTLDTVLAQAQLPPDSHLARVVVSEAERIRALSPFSFDVEDVSSRAALAANTGGRFEQALRDAKARDGGAVIAEFKRASPSLGPFAMDRAFNAQLSAYNEGGAACVSILAEPALFCGSAQDVRAAQAFAMPVLYKGFVLGEAHLAEALASGADAVLLIARVLRGHTAVFADAARALGLEPLIEVHDATELAWAAGAHARLLGINARDLATFSINTPTVEPLRAACPDALLIRESGLSTPDDLQAAFAAGFDAVLVGEALMRSADPAAFLRAGRGQA